MTITRVNNKKHPKNKELKMDCNTCESFKTIAVKCFMCEKYYCRECWHEFHVHAYKYLKAKGNYFYSTACGNCMEICIKPNNETIEEVNDEKINV